MRAPQSYGLVALVLIAVGSTACAVLSGLSDFSERAAGDAGGSADSRALDARFDATAPTADAVAELPDDAAGNVRGSEASSNDAAGDVGGSDASSNDAEAYGDASDGGQPADAADGGPGLDGGSDGGCQLYTHANGLGQTFVDCVPLDTYDTAEAAKACAAADAGTCVANSMVCFGATLECTPRGSDPCACWSYSGSTAGHVATTRGGFCGGPNECPMASDTQWQ